MVDTGQQALADGLRQGRLPPAPDAAQLQAAVQALADAVPHGGESLDDIRRACKALNGRRHFALTRLLAQAWHDTRYPTLGLDLMLQRLLAQAVINLSALDEGERLVNDGLKAVAQADPKHPDTVREGAELRGLRGRIAKQRYADGGNLAQLDEAVRRYLDAMDQATPAASIWPGVNALALLHRREHEQLPAWAGVDVLQLAKRIERSTQGLLKKAPDDAWLAATMSECKLAQDKADDAELWLYRFMLHPSVDAFGLDSYDRQLREIWGGVQGRNQTLADRLETLMAQHLLAQQSRWTMSPGGVADLRQQIAADRAGFEKNFSGEYSFSLDTLESLLRCCASIGCVSNQRGERLGTGFLVRGSDLKAAWGDGAVFVTNAHVIGTQVDKAIAPQDVRVSFEVESAQAAAPLVYTVAQLMFTSPPADLGALRPQTEALDVTVVRLQPASQPGQPLPASLAGLPVAPALPLIEASAKAYVVGHPSGSGLQISLHDSQLLDIDDVDRLLHYRTPTEPGSSGSPVFNAQWQLMAVHHGGSAKMPRLRGEGSYQANEGISLLALRKALATL